MPVVSHPNLPSLERMESSELVFKEDDSKNESFSRHLHIGFLNLMPDAAFQATERQFVNMLASNEELLVHLYPTSVATEERGNEFKDYIDKNYNLIKDIQQRKYDGFIISGANPSQQDMTKETFWNPLIEVFEWAEGNSNSVLCSCLATHAIMKAKYGIERQLRHEKAWGIFRHDLGNANHPLILGLEDGFDGPHSHYYDFPLNEIESTDLEILASNDFAGMYLASSKDGSLVLFQGHPEYGANSLLKEYQREINNFVSESRTDYPPLPNDYFSESKTEKIEELKQSLISEPKHITLDESLISDIDHDWQSAGKIIYQNWLHFLDQG
ncbi:MAG TPA: homoserine O-succinyltransferase [Gammaproteobacteria bacterium]|nr:homoserine O-succinyltransferase [Gammaproteobacteria bacterium]|tara:strand:- start:2937 stop:3917 length:981 start_codon:yes stop_codon:yes gene_type:complete